MVLDEPEVVVPPPADRAAGEHGWKPDEDPLGYAGQHGGCPGQQRTRRDAGDAFSPALESEVTRLTDARVVKYELRHLRGGPGHPVNGCGAPADGALEKALAMRRAASDRRRRRTRKRPRVMLLHMDAAAVAG
ncbi:hypothetical protein FE251_04390 [Georgenia wutianyii]|uniref:Uncharacterized protein n=1 Tax=Georgenia wutianyii TaxID=2585135 RepID=A0ABX5VMX8_9MICO|nr:hypothetical protein [Georgenia wutianyii]QDB78698.1 hypothetical protein FE251_04390 [Georgenia wutianyii]